MPTPADIILRIKEIRKDRREREELKNKPRAIEAPKRVGKKSVPWALKDWTEFTEADREGLAKHLTTLSPETRDDYTKYLIHWCNVPARVLV